MRLSIARHDVLKSVGSAQQGCDGSIVEVTCRIGSELVHPSQLMPM